MKKSTRILRKESSVPVQKIIGDRLGAVGLKQYEALEEKYYIKQKQFVRKLSMADKKLTC